MVQREDVEALNCVENIATVKGVDLLFIGPGDLKQSAKAHGVLSDTFMDEAYERVDNAAKAAGGTWWGTVTGTPEAAKKLYDAGCRFINIRRDFGAVYSGLSALASGTRNLF
jgi:2-keto-3-deoxy-L-rhamnonate aldolase RhmA